MSVSYELLNPALQDIGEDDLSFNHFVIPSFDEPSVEIPLVSKEIKNLSYNLNIKSVDEFKHTVFFNVETPEGLNWYCDRILERIEMTVDETVKLTIDESKKEGLIWDSNFDDCKTSLRGIIPVHVVESVRRTWLHKYMKGDIIQPVPERFRKVDDYSAWKKRGKKAPIQVSSISRYDEPRDVTNLKLSEAWIVPDVPVKAVKVSKPTPSNYSTFAFKRWVHFSAQNLRRLITKKSQKAVGNTEARFLYQQANPEILHASTLRRCLQDAKVYVYDFSHNSKKPSKPTNWKISDFMPKAPAVKRVLYFGNRVMNEDNIFEFEKYFKRHRPRFVSACKYLRGEINPVLAVLQKEIDVVVEDNRPKNLSCGGQIFDKERIMRNQRSLSKPLFRLCMRHFSGDKSVNFGALQSQFSKLTLQKLQMLGDEYVIHEELEMKSDDPEGLDFKSESYTPDVGGDVRQFAASNDIVSTVLDTLLAVKTYMQESNWNEPLKLMTMLIALHHQTSWKGCLSVISLYAVSVDITRWKDSFEKLKAFTPPTFRLQSGEETNGELPKGFSVWEFLSPLTEWGKELWTCLSELIWGTIAPCFVPTTLWENLSKSSFTQEFIGRLRNEQMKIAAKSVAEYIVHTLMQVFSLFRTCIRLKSLKPLYMTVFDPIKWREEVTAVVTYYAEIQVSTDQPVNIERWKALKAGGFIPADWLEPFTPHSLSLFIDNLVKTGDEFLLTFRSDPVLGNDLRKLLSSMRALQEANSIGYGVMAQRVQPFGVYISGIAGSGKTNLSDAIFKTIGRANSYSTEPTMKYSWQKGVNFQDSLGFSQWCITLDDIDTSPAAPTMGFESHVDAVIRIINNAPLVVEQSRVEAKGKVAAKPLLVMMTSNFENARLQSYALEPTRKAFYRRFPVWLKLKAKETFGKGGVLDKEAASKCVDGELWDMQVFKFDNAVPGDFPYSLVDTVNTKSDLLKYVIVEYRKHMNQQLEMLQRSSGGDYCLQCFADWQGGVRCSCKTVDQMRWEFIVFPTIAAMMYRWVPPIFQREKAWLMMMKSSLEKTVETAAEASAIIRSTVMQAEMTRSSFVQRVDKFFYQDFKYIAGAAVVLAIINLSWKFYKDYQDRSFFTVSQGVERNAVEGAVPTAWVRVPQEYRPGMPVEHSTFTKDEAIEHIRDSYVRIVTRRGSGNGIVVSNSGVICPLHYFRELGSFTSIPESSDETFEVIQKGITHKLLFNVFNVTQLYTDSVFIKVPGLTGYTGVGKKFWVDVDNTVSQFDELVLVRSNELLPCNGMSALFNSTRIVKSNADTVDGDCGYAYLARMNKHWKIVAIHTARNESTMFGLYAVGMVITQNTMMTAAARLALKFQMLSIPLKQTGMNYDKQTYSHFPPKSEVWAAVSHYGVQVAPIGQANIKVHGSTIKSEIKPTLYAEDFEDLEIKWCGRPDYWQIPNFKGEMRDGKWFSPYTNSLTPLMRVTHKNEFLMLALMEYLNGIEELQFDGYSEISLEEAIIGIPGSVIQAADLKTSVGMPFNQPKTTKIVVRNEQAYADPYLMEMTQDIRKDIESNVIPCPVALCMLKDEAISWNKNLDKRARIFNVLPFSFNWNTKAKMAPAECFMRANKGFFGSMVGINMTSLEINEVVRILAQSDPELRRIIALDIKTEDKAMDGMLIDIISLVFYAIMSLLGADAISAYTIVQALKSAVFIIKNDLFQVGATNLSGQDKTVTWNCIVTSIALIYMYLRMKYGDTLPDDLRKIVIDYQRNFFELKGLVPAVAKPHLTYRTHCSKGTYGDDSLQSVAENCKFYDVNRIPELGLELGLVFTDEAKTDKITFKKITECSFLKRTFVWREDLKSYVGRLSLKTLAKMLRMRKKSSLTDRDHAAEQLTNVLRELAYYDKEDYDYFKERALKVAEKYELKENAYLRTPTYEEYNEQMKEGSFSTWAPIVLKHKNEVEATKITLQMNSNNSIDLKPVIDEAKSVPVEGQVMSNELGWFHSATSTMKSGAPSGAPVSSLPKTTLGDFLLRMTHIGGGTLATTDLFNSDTLSIDPWTLFLQSAFIAPKVENYKYIRGTLEVQVSVNAPAGAYGLYILYAVPFGDTALFQGANSQIGAGYIDGATTVPHVLIDLATCTDGKILLPWCHWNDYAVIGDTTTAEGISRMWKLNMKCLQPISIATGTATPVATFRVWARCTPDYDMVIPYNQMMPASFDDARAMVNNETDNFRDNVNDASIKATGMRPSGIAGAIATGATAVAAAVPFLAPLAGTAAAIASGASAILSWFGFTREMAQQVPTMVVRRNYSNVANMDADDTSEVAALLRDNAISIDPRLAGNTGEDLAAFNYLMSKYTLIGYTAWTPSDAAQDELISFPVTPHIARLGMDTAYAPTVAGYLGFPFQYWRGSMEYMIVIPMSKFHRGVLQVSWSPDAAYPVTDITNTRFNHILDCSTCSTWEFTVGYANTIPMLENVPHVFGSAIPSTAGANGMLTISVANPLTSPVETATTSIFVFARGCADMDFSVPRTTFQPVSAATGLGSVRDFATGFKLQMSEGAIGNDKSLVKRFGLVPNTTSITKELCSGERFDSVRGLAQKFSQDFRIQRAICTNVATPFVNHFPSFPQGSQYFDTSITPIVTTNTQYFTWCGYYCALYTGIAASCRYKFVNNCAAKVALGIAARPCAYGVNSSTSACISSVNPVWSVITGEGVEITVPYYYNRRFFPTWFWTKASEVLAGTAQGRINEMRAEVINQLEVPDYNGITGYVAYGPDIRFGQFRYMPRISISGVTSTPDGWGNDITPS